MNLREKLIEENCRGRYTQEMSKKELVNFIFDYFEAQQKPKALTVQVPNEYTNINQDAFNEWMAYKKYKNKGAITKTLNMLNKHDYQVQQEMVDLSIGNEYKGLFPPKVKRSRTDNNVNVAKSWLEENQDTLYINGDC